MKEIRLGAEARQLIKQGIDKAADAVAPTLGAIGMAALIDWEGLDPIVSDDGVTILKNLEFSDRYQNMGLKMLRKGAVRTSVEGGDGTATTTVLTRALVNEAFDAISQDSSKIQEVRQRLIDGRDEVLSRLQIIKREVKPDEIESIAKISSLDDEVAKLIAETISDVGINGVVTVEKSAKLGYEKEVVKGMRFESGLISPYFITDHEREQAVLENPAIVLVDRKVSLNEQITSVMNSIGKSGNLSVLWIADDIESLALASLIINQQRGTFQVACVKNPYTSTRAKDFLHDLAALTGGTVISEEAGMKLNEATVEQTGTAEKVVITKDTCTIIGGKSSPALLERIASIEKKIAETTSEYEKKMLQERLASLTTGIGVIRVGAYTDTEFNAKKLKFENAINATQAALAEGILPGGGIALLSIVDKVEDPMFKATLKAPFKQMMKNAGLEEMLQGSYWNIDEGFGINFRTKEVVDMVASGIIDPFKVTRLALESAVAVALNLITTETAIVNIEPLTQQ